MPGPKGNLNAMKHGWARGDKTPEWRAWRDAKKRCTNPRFQHWARYGGRGIRMCTGWLHDPMAFIRHVGPRPSPKHSVDRIDNNGHYEPGNVRWATRSEQVRNSQPRKLTPLDVDMIRHWLARGYTQGVIANAFSVCQPAISDIKTGRRHGGSVADGLRAEGASRLA